MTVIGTWKHWKLFLGLLSKRINYLSQTSKFQDSNSKISRTCVIL